MAKKIQTVKAVALVGKVSNQEASAETENKGYKVIGSHPDFPEIEKREGTFSISVKDDEGNVIYENKKEPFQYYSVPSFSSALKFFGAKLDANQMQFISEGLSGKETGEANLKILEIINADLRDSAKASTYSSKYNEKKPVTEEQLENAVASIVRNYLKTNPGVSDETAIATLAQFKVIPADFTVADYRGNKGKR